MLSRMDMLSIDQRLARAWAILKSKTLELTMVMAAATQVTLTKYLDVPIGPHIDITCHACNRLNYLAQPSNGYHIRGKPAERVSGGTMLRDALFSVLHHGSPGAYLSRKQDNSASHFPVADKNLALPLIKLRGSCARCSMTQVASKDMCQSWQCVVQLRKW